MAQSLALLDCASSARTCRRPQSDADDPAYSCSFCSTASCGLLTAGVEDAEGPEGLLQAANPVSRTTDRRRGIFMAKVIVNPDLEFPVTIASQVIQLPGWIAPPLGAFH